MQRAPRTGTPPQVFEHETAKPGVGVSHAGVQDQGEDRRGSERRGRWNENAAEAGVRVAAPVRGGAFVGRRISRYWNGERRWFRGTLVEYTAGNGYRVEYDDGDVEEGVEFPDESVRVLPLGSDGAKTR